MTVDNLLDLVLHLIQTNELINSLKIAQILNVDHQKIVGIIKSLEIQPDFIKTEVVNEKRWKVCEEGQFIIQSGSHEAKVFAAVPSEGIDFDQLMALFQDKSIAKLGFSKAMSSKWIGLDKKDNKQRVFKKIDNIVDSVKNDLLLINDNQHEKVSDDVKKDLKKRKLIEEVLIKSYNITKDSGFKTSVDKQETDLTSEMILKGTWKDKKFKEYNFSAKGIVPEKGHLHPLLKFKEQFRQIFLELGFEEMPTNNYVESSFWNFDALFQPQQHPARDAHDTFFLSDPQFCNTLPNDYLEKVKKVHSEGGFGSQGYQYDWKLSEAKKNLLRTHTTAVSARMLYEAAERYRNDPSAEFIPLKYFSIDRVFRNENLDATHLAEFNQIEGVVADVGLTLGNLMGVLQQFFEKLGIKNLKFKPAYNPYTEPSMEIFSYHEGLKKWVEVGNSGMFRPELLQPMGLPENVTVIAWGLSLERPTMIKYKLDNIRDIVGHKIDLETVYNNPICILDA